MSASIIILDSSDEEEDIEKDSKVNHQKKTTTPVVPSAKFMDSPERRKSSSPSSLLLNTSCNQPKNYPLEERSKDSSEDNLKRKATSFDQKEPQLKRVKPILISNKIDHNQQFEDEEHLISMNENFINNSVEFLEKKRFGNAKEIENVNKISTTNTPDTDQEEDDTTLHMEIMESNAENEITENNTTNPINSTYAALIEACRKADPSDDMNKLIKMKLIKYYNNVHPDFVNSKGFLRTVKAVTSDIEANPQLVYYKLKPVIEELKIRKRSKCAVITNEEITSTGSERRDIQVRRLSRALYRITKKIKQLDESEADLDDDNSVYLQCERFKKRACQIYEKICDLTGESKHAHRLVKKPIHFNGTDYLQFNRTIQTFVNKTKSFPDYLDVYRCLEHCNKIYDFDLTEYEMKKIAEDAFLQIGKLLQKRRKTDLYETVAHFTGASADPALEDKELDAKLSENQKHQTKISSIIDLFAKEQENEAFEKKFQKDENIRDEKFIKNGSDSFSPKKAAHVGEQDDETLATITANGDKFTKQKECTPEREKKEETGNLNTKCKKSDNLNPIEEIIISDDEGS